MKLEWNVFYHNINAQKIELFNIFNHGRFREDVRRNLEIIKDRDEFAEALRKDLSYYFRFKSEWEIVISPWSGGRGTEDIKIDIYTQVMNNWDTFVYYCWNSER